MEVNCIKYSTKEIIRFMRECTEKTQKEFAGNLNRKGIGQRNLKVAKRT